MGDSQEQIEDKGYVICIITYRKTKQPGVVLIEYRTKYLKPRNHEVNLCHAKSCRKSVSKFYEPWQFGFPFAENHNLVIILSLINFCGKTRTSKNQNQFRLTLSVLFKSSYGVPLKRKGKYEFI